MNKRKLEICWKSRNKIAICSLIKEHPQLYSSAAFKCPKELVSVQDSNPGLLRGRQAL
jgi:hypothetical protein